MTALVASVRLGQVEIVQILDTVLEMPAREVFPGLGDDDYVSLGEAGPYGSLTIPVYVYAVRSDDRTTLIDSGVGDPPETGTRPGRLLDGLAAAGIAPDDIDTVVYTHLHPDHIGGSTDADGGLVFPRARHVVTRAEWDFWQLPVWRDAPWEWLGAAFARRLDPLTAAGEIDLLDGPGEIEPHLRARSLAGHTPGQIGIEVDTGARPVLFIGDALHHPFQWERPDVRWRDDADAAMASTARAQLASDVADSSTVVASAHFPHPGTGHLTRAGGTARWRPAALDAPREASPSAG